MPWNVCPFGQRGRRKVMLAWHSQDQHLVLESSEVPIPTWRRWWLELVISMCHLYPNLDSDKTCPPCRSSYGKPPSAVVMNSVEYGGRGETCFVSLENCQPCPLSLHPLLRRLIKNISFILKHFGAGIKHHGTACHATHPQPMTEYCLPT